MGINIMGSSASYDKKPASYPNTSTPLPNPNPDNYEVLKTFQMGTYLIVELRYPDCTNYEGKKIMVYEKTTIKQLLDQGKIDPHFSNHPYFRSPVARFEPSMKGWDMAKVFCAAMVGQKIS
jgi:hypothetical protein